MFVMIDIKQGDCLELMREIPDASIDCIITDPPYFVPAFHYGATIRLKTTRLFSRNFADLGILEHFFKDTFAEFKRIMKPTGTMYIFCDGQSYPMFYYHLYPFCKSIRPLIWDKKAAVNGYSWRHQHELIIYAEMPQAPALPSGDGDILRFSAIKMDNRKHPAEKPLELIQALIKKSTREGNLVLDPFMGSGTTGIACRQTNRDFIGFELSQEYFKIAEQRIYAEAKQVGLIID